MTVRENARVYEAVQRLFGVTKTKRLLAAHLTQTADSSLVDVGAGTGAYIDLIPASTRYVGVDLDPVKIARLRARWPQRDAVVGDATDLPFDDGAFDFGLCVALTHHLDDAGLGRLVDELARVVRQRVVFLDAVWEPRALAGRALWRIDRGSHPRPEADLRRALERRFDLEHAQRHSVYHHYLFCVLAPRPS